MPSSTYWREVDALIVERLEAAQSLVQRRQDDPSPPIANTLALDTGVQAMKGIRERMAEMDRQQKQNIFEINERIEVVQRRAERLSWGSTGLTVFLMLASTGMLLREREARRRLEGQLRQVNQGLEAHVRQRTEDLLKARDRIRGFAQAQERGIEAERRRLSREVHDQIGQVFTGIKLIFKGLPQGSLPPDQERMLMQALDSGTATARRISTELRPPLLDDLGLEAALQHLCHGLLAATSVRATVSLEEPHLVAEAHLLGVFRIAQEAITNVLRHANATELIVRGWPDDDAYCLLIEDNGSGIDTTRLRPGALGLTGMHERAELLGGTVSIEVVAEEEVLADPSTQVSATRPGTRVRLRLPLAAAP